VKNEFNLKTLNFKMEKLMKNFKMKARLKRIKVFLNNCLKVFLNNCLPEHNSGICRGGMGGAQ
jgi:hypothetical protein